MHDGRAARGADSQGTASSTLPIRVIPVSPERWADVATIMGGPAAWGCWCQYYRWSSGDYGRLGRDGGARALRGQLADHPAPGLLAYLDDDPVGWCGLGVRSHLERLVRSRTIPLVDDRPVWSIVCFIVRPGMRRRGIAGALLEGAVTYAREQGAVALEGYPVDPEGARLQTAALYVGTTSMFEAAGFSRVVMTDSRTDHRARWLMRLDLVPGAPARRVPRRRHGSPLPAHLRPVPSHSDRPRAKRA